MLSGARGGAPFIVGVRGSAPHILIVARGSPVSLLEIYAFICLKKGEKGYIIMYISCFTDISEKCGKRKDI